MKKLFLVVVSIFVTKCNATQKQNDFKDLSALEDAKLNFTGLACKYAGRCEEYDVTTEDGYVLKVFRIPGQGKPVLLQHGLLDTADTFILRGESSLAVILAKQGYDVWAGNLRGNRYSRKHLTLNPDQDQAFWNFSFHEHGYYDMPAMIDFISNNGGRKVNVIGHSQGTTVIFVLGSTRPEYNRKIGLFIALAPVVFLQNIGRVLKYVIFPIIPFISKLMRYFQQEEFLGKDSLLGSIVEKLCTDPDLGALVCLHLAIFPFTGVDAEELEPSFVPVYFSHFPAGSTVKNINHFAQVGRSGRFANYDYGFSNLVKYGSVDPPVYDLGNVTMPTALVVSENDGFSSVEDTNRIRTLLPNVVNYLIVQAPFNHIDFTLGRNSYRRLYPTILKVLQQYTSILE